MNTPHPDRHAQAPAKTRFIFVTGGVVSSLGKGIAAASIGRLLVARGLTRRTAEVRPLHQRRSGHDVPLPARRGVRDRGRRRDRPRPRSLRALHRLQHEPRLERHGRRHLRHRDPPRAPRGLPRRHGPGGAAHHRRDQAADRADRRVDRRGLRHHRDRGHGRGHRVAAVPGGDPPVPGGRRTPPLHVHPSDARSLHRPRGRAEDQADAALGQRAAAHRHRPGHAHVPLGGLPVDGDPQEDRPVREPAGRMRSSPRATSRTSTRCRSCFASRAWTTSSSTTSALQAPAPDLSSWQEPIERAEQAQRTVRIALVGKYVRLEDAYLSVSEALRHAAAFRALGADRLDRLRAPGGDPTARLARAAGATGSSARASCSSRPTAS